MSLQTKRVFIRRIELKDVYPLLELRINNREFLQPFEPKHLHTDSHFTIEAQTDIVHTAAENWRAGVGYSFGIFRVKSDTLIGRVNLSNIVRGAWQNCTVGYFLDERMNGQGYMTEAVSLAVRFAFEEIGLHRVQAAIMPRNIGSKRVVEKVGFRYEGLSKRYLEINGVWEDHLIYAVTKEEWVEC